MIVPSGETGHVDPVPHAVRQQLDAFVDQALSVQPLGDAELVEQIDGGVLEHAGSDPALDVAAVLGLDDDGVDAVAGE